MAHRKWYENKQPPGTAGPGNMLGCCLVSFYFLWAIHPIRPLQSNECDCDRNRKLSSYLPIIRKTARKFHPHLWRTHSAETFHLSPEEKEVLSLFLHPSIYYSALETSVRSLSLSLSLSLCLSLPLSFSDYTILLTQPRASTGMLRKFAKVNCTFCLITH